MTIEPETGTLAPTAEIVLFVAGGVLTLLVIAFVSWLLVHATREEKRRVESERSETEESESGPRS